MSVWVLLMVLLAPPGGFESSYFLNKFDNATDCQTERDRIGFQMAESYPDDLSFRIECREKPTPIATEEQKRIQYDEIIKGFSKTRYPNQETLIKVTNVKALKDESGTLPIIAIQVNIFHNDGGNSYIVLIKQGSVMGWIDAGEVAEEEEEDEENIFPGKEFA